MPEGTLHDMLREKILRLRANENAPAGWEIIRILGEATQFVGPGANYETVYVVAVREMSVSRPEGQR